MTPKTLTPVSKPVRLMAATLLMALAGSAALVAQAQPMGGGHRGGPMGGPEAMFGGRMSERLLDSVDASAEQRTRIRDIMKSAMADLRQQREASRGLREQALTLFTQPTVDARAAEALRLQMLQQHDQSSRRMMQAMLDASAVLTPEQRAKMAERMKQRRDVMERHQRERRSTETPKS